MHQNGSIRKLCKEVEWLAKNEAKEADCYILVPYEVSDSSCFMSVEKRHGKVQVLNDNETVNIMEYIDSVVVCTGEKQQKYEKDNLTEKIIWKLLDETLSGVWNRLMVEFSIQEEEYVDRLDKYVSRRRKETLLIFSEKEGMALLYFCRKDLECYKLISHCIPSKEVEIPVGNTKLLRCIVHQDRRNINNGIQQIFRNIENVYEALKHTEEWCAEYPKGKNGFNKICRKYGVAEEI